MQEKKEEEVVVTDQDNENLAKPDDKDRRTVIKAGVCALGAAYIAPVTLDLLMADRATAQSALRISFTNNSSSMVSVSWVGLRVDGVAPGARVLAPAGTDGNTTIEVTSLTPFLYTCPNAQHCSTGPFGGTLDFPIDTCGGQVAITDCVLPFAGGGSGASRW